MKTESFTTPTKKILGYTNDIPNELIIPSSVESIENYAFHGCSKLTSVKIPDSVISIGNWAFGYCESLTSVTIPDSVTRIGYEAFGGCIRLTSITNPDSVTDRTQDFFE